MTMHRQTKATSISSEVKSSVYVRDRGRCIICGRYGNPWCHVVPRSAGGKGVEENIVTLCNECHYTLDEGLNMKRLRPLGFENQSDLKQFVRDYMKKRYPGWTEESVKYNKYDFSDKEE